MSKEQSLWIHNCQVCSTYTLHGESTLEILLSSTFLFIRSWSSTTVPGEEKGA